MSRMTMSAGVSKPKPTSSSQAPSPEGPEATSHGPDLNVLVDRVPAWLQAPRVLALWTAVIGLTYLVLSYQPLWHTDLWGHLSYGRWIVQHGGLPETEPLMPLSRGVPFVDTAWLTQITAYGLYRAFGIAALQLCYAATIAASFALLLAGALRRTQGSIAAGFVAIVTFGVVDYQQMLVIRPQLAGLACFVLLFVMMTAFRWRKAYWVMVPLLFAVWANLHGSFIVGLALLATCCAGRAADVLVRTGSVRAAAADRTVRRLFVLTELAAVAVLANPYGLGLYAEVFAVAGHPNLRDLIEWEPLTLHMAQGKAFVVCVFALIVAYRFSPRRVRAREVLLLAGLGGAALWSSRMIVWWAPVAAYYLALHVAAILPRHLRFRSADSPRSGKWSVVTVGLAWIFFAYTPFGVTLLHGRPPAPEARARRFEKSASAQTPLDVAAYLHRHPPRGLVFNTFDWGDFLLWAGPPELEVFAASHVHVIPTEVWRDYLSILHTGSGWENKLDRYGVNTVVLDKRDDDSLLGALRAQSDDWRIDFENSAAAVFVRRNPL